MAIGYWLLAIGYWLLAIGYLLFAICYLMQITQAIYITSSFIMKKQALALILTSVFSSSVMAGGILLHEVATFDSVSSAGVANATNRNDASAAITSPAGLTAIKDSSFSVGLQYIDAYSEHNGTGFMGGDLHASGENKALAPSLAYAKRVNDSWVVGASLHADGGLGMDYTNGLSGLNLFDAMSQEAVNVHLAAGYQVNTRLSLGGALVVQHLMTSLDASIGDITIEGEANSTAASFILSGMFNISDNTYIAANYKHRVDHRGDKIDVTAGNMKTTVANDVIWPARLDLGLHHQINDKLAVKAMTGVEFWSDFDRDDDLKDVYSVGAAMSYSLNNWQYQAGVRYDSTLQKSSAVAPELAVGKNWAVGLGAEKTRANGHRVGLAYEYRDLGEHDVSYDNGFTGRVDDQRLHILSLSYAY
ncbi:OmpP1/FadL family transporter [Photobacterium rosenbergii]|uniref:OmpP1/FadL family transporter n=1 Tax=Photobacterium rosenbergii TaxID=294936 RepID=UPI001C990926|nr:outer membrane protein transport protein [Photobacterium rosenbergii]MBY5945063.1 outer membrane protein transport protein [Photobacterium rosenbergii]